MLSRVPGVRSSIGDPDAPTDIGRLWTAAPWTPRNAGTGDVSRIRPQGRLISMTEPQPAGIHTAVLLAAIFSLLLILTTVAAVACWRAL